MKKNETYVCEGQPDAQWGANNGPCTAGTSITTGQFGAAPFLYEEDKIERRSQRHRIRIHRILVPPSILLLFCPCGHNLLRVHACDCVGKKLKKWTSSFCLALSLRVQVGLCHVGERATHSVYVVFVLVFLHVKRRRVRDGARNPLVTPVRGS